MRNKTISAVLKILALTLLVAVAGACSRDALKKGTSEATNAPTQYDLTVLADKDTQFEFDGATLTAEDLRGHIRYLNEAGRPVHTLLLQRGEHEKIKNDHVAALASIARDLHVTAYVMDNNGHLKVIQIAD